MQNIFVTIICLLFLNACSEEKAKNNDETPQPTIEKETNTTTNENTENENVPNTQETELTIESNTDKKIENIQNSGEPITAAPLDNQDNAEQVSPEIPKKQETQEKVKTTSNINNHNKAVPVKASFNVEDNDMVLGNRESKVVLVEYFSPTCPHCAYYNTAIFPEIKAKYIDTNKIAYVVREFIATKQDLDASILARCKGDLDSFIQFHKIILSQQDKWAYNNQYQELLTNIGQLGGISPEEYKQCLNNDKITEILIANTNFIARTPRFIGTPAFFVNGLYVDQGYAANSISAAIDKALNKVAEETSKAGKNEIGI